MKKSFVLGVAALSYLAVGCGSSDEPTSASPEADESQSAAETADPGQQYCEALVRIVTDYDSQIIDMSGLYDELYSVRNDHPEMTADQERWTNEALRENKEESGFQKGLLNLAYSCKNDYDTPLGDFAPNGGWSAWSPS